MNAKKPGGNPAPSTPICDDTVSPRVARPTDSAKIDTPRNPVPRMRDAKNLKWLKPYTALGYTFQRNSHLKAFDPEGRLVTTITCTGHDSEYRGAKARLRRYERGRKDQP